MNYKKNIIKINLLFLGIKHKIFDSIYNNNLSKLSIDKQYLYFWLIAAQKNKLIKKTKNNIELTRKSKNFITTIPTNSKYIIEIMQAFYYTMMIDKASESFLTGETYGYSLTNNCKNLIEYYSMITNYYNIVFYNSIKKLKEIKNIFSRTKSFSVLDYGCGNGDLLKIIKKEYNHSDCYGYENNEINQSENLNIFNYIPNIQFDLIIIRRRLHHEEKWQDIILNIIKFKKKSGLIIVDEINYPNNTNPDTAFWGILEHIQSAHYISMKEFISFFNKQEISYKIYALKESNLYILT